MLAARPTLLTALLPLLATACFGAQAKLDAVVKADAPAMAGLGLWGMPGDDGNKELVYGALDPEDDKILTAIMDAAEHGDETTKARIQCHVRQTEAVDLLVQAMSKNDLDVDEKGQVEVSRLVPRTRTEGLEAQRNYTLERRVDDEHVTFIARGTGSQAGDVWARQVARSADWMAAMMAPVSLVEDTCAKHAAR